MTVIAAAGTAMVAGVFFAFSTFVMQGLGRLPAPEAARAMQSINVTAVRPAFMTLLFGTAAVCVAAMVAGWRDRGSASSPWLLAAGLLYLVGTIGVTMALNVPLNDKLAALDPTAAAAEWPTYLRDWVRSNHLRTLSSTAAAVSFLVALLRGV
jgi:uncharacterized membrane protein